MKHVTGSVGGQLPDTEHLPVTNYYSNNDGRKFNLTPTLS